MIDLNEVIDENKKHNIIYIKSCSHSFSSGTAAALAEKETSKNYSIIFSAAFFIYKASTWYQFKGTLIDLSDANIDPDVVYDFMHSLRGKPRKREMVVYNLTDHTIKKAHCPRNMSIPEFHAEILRDTAKTIERLRKKE